MGRHIFKVYEHPGKGWKIRLLTFCGEEISIWLMKDDIERAVGGILADGDVFRDLDEPECRAVEFPGGYSRNGPTFSFVHESWVAAAVRKAFGETLLPDHGAWHEYFKWLYMEVMPDFLGTSWFGPRPAERVSPRMIYDEQSWRSNTTADAPDPV
jgi:hypothetical protein